MKLNGKSVALEREQTLLEFLTTASYDCRLIAVERNGVIVPKTEYETIFLADDDRVEVVRFVGGG